MSAATAFPAFVSVDPLAAPPVISERMYRKAIPPDIQSENALA